MKRRVTLGPVEKRLRESFARGVALDLRAGLPDPGDGSGGARWTAERQVRAEHIADLVRGGDAQASSVLSLVGARIVGALDLRHSRMTGPLILEDCYFDEPPDLTEANAVSVCF